MFLFNNFRLSSNAKSGLLLCGIFSCLLTLSGCVHHLTQAECRMTNWRQMGYQDGASGQPPRNLARSVKDCMKFQIPVDQKGYHRGYRKGIAEFCTPSRSVGIADGQAGKPLQVIYARQNICTQEGQPLRLKEYKRGRLQGLASFCTYDNGVNIGQQGQQPPEVCPQKYVNRFMKGWRAGGRQFCSNTGNAFALGKSGAAYPQLCPPSVYLSFKEEYDRGSMVREHAAEIDAQIADIDSRINDIAWRYDINDVFGHYELGSKHGRKARHALRRIHRLERRRAILKDEKFAVQATA